MIALQKNQEDTEKSYRLKLENLEKEYENKEKEIKENYDNYEKNLKKERERECEEYNYKLKRERDISNDKWVSEKAKREAEILNKEMEINNLLTDAQANKQKYDELEKKVLEIPKLLEAEYNKGLKDKQLELEKDYNYQSSLKEAEYKNTIDRQNDKIESLNKELEKLNSLNMGLQDKLDKSYEQLKDIATRTVEANGGVKILSNNVENK